MEPSSSQVRETFRNLRYTPIELIHHYLLRHTHLLNSWPWIHPLKLEQRPFLGCQGVLSHSWLPGMIELSAPFDRAAQQLIAGKGRPDNEHAQLAAALRDLGWLRDEPVDLDALIVKAQDVFPAVQNPNELRRFLEIVSARRPKTVLEIGTATGGTFYCLSQVADPSALLISIDFLGGEYGGGQTLSECRLFATFGPSTQKFEFIRQRSFLQSALQAVRKILNGREIDLLFIDGDHSYAAVKSDYERYHPLVAKDGMTAFHDIIEVPEQAGEWQQGNEVSIFWKELSPTVKSQEIIDLSFLTAPWGSRETRSRIWPPLGIGLVLNTHREGEA